MDMHLITFLRYFLGVELSHRLILKCLAGMDRLNGWGSNHLEPSNKSSRSGEGHVEAFETAACSPSRDSESKPISHFVRDGGGECCRSILRTHGWWSLLCLHVSRSLALLVKTGRILENVDVRRFKCSTPAVTPEMVTCLCSSRFTWYLGTDGVNAFFSVSVRKKVAQTAVMWNRWDHTFTVSPAPTLLPLVVVEPEEAWAVWPSRRSSLWSVTLTTSCWSRRCE